MTETLFKSRNNPCKGCTDRYPGCSDHCRKPAFLDYRAEQQLIRENLRKYNSMYGYMMKEIEKNRRKWRWN